MDFIKNGGKRKLNEVTKQVCFKETVPIVPW